MPMFYIGVRGAFNVKGKSDRRLSISGLMRHTETRNARVWAITRKRNGHAEQSQGPPEEVRIASLGMQPYEQPIIRRHTPECGNAPDFFLKNSSPLEFPPHIRPPDIFTTATTRQGRTEYSVLVNSGWQIAMSAPLRSSPRLPEVPLHATR